MTGGVSGPLTTTVTVWLHVLVLLQQSVACQVRVMVGEQPPLLVMVPTILMMTLVPQQSSTADGASKFQMLPQVTVLLPAQVKTGGLVSMTVTAWLHVAVLLQ